VLIIQVADALDAYDAGVMSDGDDTAGASRPDL